MVYRQVLWISPVIHSELVSGSLERKCSKPNWATSVGGRKSHLPSNAVFSNSSLCIMNVCVCCILLVIPAVKWGMCVCVCVGVVSLNGPSPRQSFGRHGVTRASLKIPRRIPVGNRVDIVFAVESARISSKDRSHVLNNT